MAEQNEERRKSSHQKNAAELLEGVRELEQNLAPGYEVHWEPAEIEEDGVISLAFPRYPDWLWFGVWDATVLLMDALGYDHQPYYERAKTGEMGPIPEADLNELTGWFAMYANGERFCDGLIASGVEDGNILAMARRLLELVPNVDGLVYPRNLSDTNSVGRSR